MVKKQEKQLASTDFELFQKYRVDRNPYIRNEIVSRYVYLAEILSKKFINRGVDYDDIYQVACIALINAVERFESMPREVCQLSTHHHRGDQRIFRDKASVIRIPGILSLSKGE